MFKTALLVLMLALSTGCATLAPSAPSESFYRPGFGRHYPTIAACQLDDPPTAAACQLAPTEPTVESASNAVWDYLMAVLAAMGQ